MGINWKYAMPLLSTLAALVIIVNSAEEDMGLVHRRDLRTRHTNPGTPKYEEPWRVLDVEPIQSPQANDKWEKTSTEEPIRRRRLRRKRRRRIEPVSGEDLIPQERHVYPVELSRPEIDTSIEYLPHTTEKTERQKPDNIPDGLQEQAEGLHPFKRKGLRRQRPSLKAWPLLSEFGGYKPPPELYNRHMKLTMEQDSAMNMDDIKSPTDHFVQTDFEDDEDDDEDFMEETTSEAPEFISDNTAKYKLISQQKEDISLSEFSMEVMNSDKGPILKEETVFMNNKLRDKANGAIVEYEKVQENGPIDPVTLKDILKRSNGTSLSEILQQNNLSLSDLLHGRENAISVLKSKANKGADVFNNSVEETTTEIIPVTENNERPTVKENEQKNVFLSKGENSQTSTTTEQTIGDSKIPKLITKRRYPMGLRRKQHLRPMMNTTLKNQLSRELVTVNSRKYVYNRRNLTKLKDLVDIIPAVKNMSVDNNGTTTENFPDETTTTYLFTDETTTVPVAVTKKNVLDIDHDTENKNEQVLIYEDDKCNSSLVTERTVIATASRHTSNATNLRRQSYNNNRFKNKRLKHKTSTTEIPVTNLMTNQLGTGNLASSSEIVIKTHIPIDADEDKFTTLEDFMTTERSIDVRNDVKYTFNPIKTTLFSSLPPESTTVENAKIEIEEILNDTKANARLSRILIERNMTLGELVEHRERGSSHIHLADIFHNASKEPNPPEPFLSKSLIEPISKETYPLRALLEANLHDPNAKVTTIDPISGQVRDVNIPIVMNFGSNVNENAENKGIMSLFNNMTQEIEIITEGIQESRDLTQRITLTPTNITQFENKSIESSRESHVMNKNSDDIVSWNEIFSLMHKNQNNYTEDLPPMGMLKKITIEEDADGDGLIVLEDLEQFKDIQVIIPSISNDKKDSNSFDSKVGVGQETGILGKSESHTKSITVATASIAGLALVLFLLTYAVFKWKFQRSLNPKNHNYSDERIPTPVFESRKGHKNNNSSRSISPMLSSNIYTLNTLESQNGEESTDYMWDSLRKPFQ